MRSLWVMALIASAATVAQAKDVTAPQHKGHEALTVRQHFAFMGGLSVDETEYFTRNKVITENAGRRTIVDLDAKTVTLVNKNERFYRVQTFDDLRKQDEAFRAKAGIAVSRGVTLEPTGKTQKVLGHEAKEYEIKGGALTGTVWVAPDVPLSAEALEWGRVAWMSGEQAPDAGFQEALGRLKALPLLAGITKPLGKSTLTLTTEVTEVRDKAPPAEALSVPEGFAQRTRDRVPLTGAGGSTP